jgi:hypothetical protein
MSSGAISLAKCRKKKTFFTYFSGGHARSRPFNRGAFLPRSRRSLRTSGDSFRTIRSIDGTSGKQVLRREQFACEELFWRAINARQFRPIITAMAYDELKIGLG